MGAYREGGSIKCEPQMQYNNTGNLMLLRYLVGAIDLCATLQSPTLDGRAGGRAVAYARMGVNGWVASLGNSSFPDDR